MEKLLLELVTGHCQQITLQQSSWNKTKTADDWTKCKIWVWIVSPVLTLAYNFPHQQYSPVEGVTNCDSIIPLAMTLCWEHLIKFYEVGEPWEIPATRLKVKAATGRVRANRLHKICHPLQEGVMTLHAGRIWGERNFSISQSECWCQGCVEGSTNQRLTGR